MDICESDTRVGGTWRYVTKLKNGKTVGQYRRLPAKCSAPDRFVRTERWDDWDPGETLVTTELVEQRRHDDHDCDDRVSVAGSARRGAEGRPDAEGHRASSTTRLDALLKAQTLAVSFRSSESCRRGARGGRLRTASAGRSGRFLARVIPGSTRAPSVSTLRSLCSRDSFAVSVSTIGADRTPSHLVGGNRHSRRRCRRRGCRDRIGRRPRLRRRLARNPGSPLNVRCWCRSLRRARPFRRAAA